MGQLPELRAYFARMPYRNCLSRIAVESILRQSVRSSLTYRRSQRRQLVLVWNSFSLFDRNGLRLCPLAERGSRLELHRVQKLVRVVSSVELTTIGRAIADAAKARPARILMLGGHVVKLGLSRYVVDLIERGFVSHIATNGSTAIHDFELASFGETSEDVEKWIQRGQFGLWEETSRLNDVIREGAAEGRGLGESIGRAIEEGKAPHRDLSIFAAAYRCGIPATVHVTIGADIIHSMPNCDGAALGLASYRDFLIFARSV